MSLQLPLWMDAQAIPCPRCPRHILPFEAYEGGCVWCWLERMAADDDKEHEARLAERYQRVSEYYE